MKLLIITQKIDLQDSNLGFFHKWAEKFAENLDKVYVICLWEGNHNLPKNVQVYSLGKEKGYSKIRAFLRLQKFVFRNIRDVDGIFVHMCPIYAIIVYPLAKIFRKKLILWYVHKSLNCKLKLCEKCVDKIFTASEQSCRLKNRKKIKVIGHGIDIGQFKSQVARSKNLIQNSCLPSRQAKFRILSVGRIAPIKDQKTLINAVDILVNQNGIKNIEVKIIGSPLDGLGRIYFNELRSLVQEKRLKDYIGLFGGIPNKEMPKYYQDSDLVVNSSNTGSIDKVVLEAMSCECLVLTCNEAFESILEKRYFFEKENSKDLAEKIIEVKNQDQDENLRKIIARDYNLDNLIKKVINEF